MIKFLRQNKKPHDDLPLFRELQPKYPCIYVAGGYLPSRMGRAYYSLRCCKIGLGQRLTDAEDVPTVRSLGGYGIPIDDRLDRNTWQRLLSKPPTHRITFSYTLTGESRVRYLLNKDLNFRLDFESSDESTDTVCKKICRYIYFLLKQKDGELKQMQALIQSPETITGCFWLLAVQRKFRDLWKEDEVRRLY